jgi:hypothetical protein
LCEHLFVRDIVQRPIPIGQQTQECMEMGSNYPYLQQQIPLSFL